MIQSRTKGKRAELEACRALELVFDVKWQRTAQVSGKFSADVMPSQDIGLHVEVKHYASGLTWWTKRAKRLPLCLSADGFYFATLCNAKQVSKRIVLPDMAPRCGLAARWMKQAVTDAAGERTPVVLCRQNNSPWLLVWRYEDDDRLWEGVGPWLV